ncbi:MAG: hypothetical protein JRK53_16795, partial [Deltaproteobacteria bacterium]|nr:hypothetical protein [Deltaproteobacteria bacterium]
VCLESQLKWKLLWHDQIKDDTPLRPLVSLDFGVVLEASLFGVEAVFQEGSDPWCGEPVIQTEQDLDRLEPVDFSTSGIMPRIHRIYQEMGDLTGGVLPVAFPGWARGIWSVACMTRGFTPLFMDLIRAPQFVHRLMQKIVDTRIEFETQRCRFLGIDPRDDTYQWEYCVYRPTSNSAQYNDEVDGALFSADTYREFILPYERQLAEFYDGVSYYHSCGTMTLLFNDLLTLPNFYRLHVSQSSDLATAMSGEGWGKIENSLDPFSDVLEATPEHISARLAAISHTAGDRNVEVWADAIYVGGRDTLEKVKQVVALFRELHGYS